MSIREVCEMVHDIVYHDTDHQKAHEIESFVEAQAQEIEKLQAQLDELPEMLAQAFMAGQADCGDDPSWASAVEYRDSILNPPVKEEE